MINFTNSIKFLALLLGLMLAIAHSLVQVDASFDMLYCVSLMVLIGIPHGGLDHLIAEQYSKAEQKLFLLWRFLLGYVIQMGVYGLLWMIFPSLSLLIFLLISAWHFGESDLHPAPKHLLWRLVQMNWGSIILLFILLREPLFTADLLSRISRGDEVVLQVWQQVSLYSAYLYFILLPLLAALAGLAFRVEPVSFQKVRWATLLLILLIVNYLPLLPAFALYFAGWHALNTFDHIYRFLPGAGSTFSLWKKSMPLTITALVFMIITGIIWRYSFSEVDPLPLLFIFISMITLPHLVVINKMLGNDSLRPDQS